MADYSAAATSMSGVDLTTVIDNVVVGTLQAISWNITREKAPIYTMGDPNPRSFSRAKRGIAGSMTFITMDRSALWAVMNSKSHYYYAHPLELVSSSSGYSVNYPANGSTTVETGLTLGSDANATNPDTTGNYQFNNMAKGIWELTGMLTDILNADGGRVASFKTQAVYYDQIPPFNVVMVGQNEAGYAFVSSILGVEILNMGSGLSIDDITNEEQTTYIARFVNMWRPFSGMSGEIGTSARGNNAIAPASAVTTTTIQNS